MDQMAGALHLMPIDKSVSVDPDAVATAPRLRAVTKAAPDAETPDPAIKLEPIADGQDPLEARQLIKAGPFLESKDESQVRADAKSVRSWKSVLVSEAIERSMPAGRSTRQPANMTDSWRSSRRSATR